MKKGNKEKGISLYLVVVILTVLTAVLLSLISISVSQIKVVWTIGDSIKSFYAADTGVEQGLYRARKNSDYSAFSGSVGKSSYRVTITNNQSSITIKSVGSYNGIKRAIQTNY